jgi:ketosteroid isomerase-like protein
MRWHRSTLIAAAISVSVLDTTGHAQVVPGAPPTDWSVAQNEYRLNVLRDYSALIGSWHSALSGGDLAVAAATYTDRAQLLVSGHQAVQGRDSIAAFLTEFTRPLADIRTGLTDFLASDRLAYATGPMILSLRAPGSGAVRTVTGQHVTVLLREGRRWRIRSQVLKYEAGHGPDP